MEYRQVELVRPPVLVGPRPPAALGSGGCNCGVLALAAIGVRAVGLGQVHPCGEAIEQGGSVLLAEQSGHRPQNVFLGLVDDEAVGIGYVQRSGTDGAVDVVDGSAPSGR